MLQSRAFCTAESHARAHTHAWRRFSEGTTIIIIILHVLSAADAINYNIPRTMFCYIVTYSNEYIVRLLYVGTNENRRISRRRRQGQRLAQDLPYRVVLHALTRTHPSAGSKIIYFFQTVSCWSGIFFFLNFTRPLRVCNLFESHGCLLSVTPFIYYIMLLFLFGSFSLFFSPRSSSDAAGLYFNIALYWNLNGGGGSSRGFLYKTTHERGKTIRKTRHGPL